MNTSFTIPRSPSPDKPESNPAAAAAAAPHGSPEIERSRRICPREVSASGIMLGLTDPFMIPYALALGASAFQAGLLSSVRNLVLSLVQLKSADAVHWLRSRKALVLWTAGLQVVLWVPLAFVSPVFGAAAVPALIVLYTVGTSSSAFGGPAWGSMVSGYLGAHERGRYFGGLARRVGYWSTAATLAAGGLLHLLRDRPILGFGLLCASAAVARGVSWSWLCRLTETPLSPAEGADFSFWQFLRQVRSSNFVHFTLAAAAMSFGVNLLVPILPLWILRELRFGYFTYALIQLSTALTGALFVARWGRAADRAGNHAVLRWTMLGVAAIPLLWIVIRFPAGLVALGLASGAVWGGLNLCMVNFVYDSAVPAKRARCLAYFNVVNGCGVSLGALAGGWLLGRVSALWGSPFVTVFLLSAVLRFAAVALFRRWVREVRPVRAVGLREVVYDLARTRVVNVLGFLSVKPEEEGEEGE